jgi:serine/threonine-protein kinase
MQLPDQLQRALGATYRIERELGQGGMATVYLADDLKHDRQVAVKVLRPELAAALGPDRFTREIRIAARLQHPHILPLLDSGQAEGFLYYVMPYVGGQSLRDRLARQGELPVHEAVRLLVEIADALAFAHAQGVVHRDIKPDNILLSGRHALVMDFGVAKAVSEATGRHTLTSVGVAIGTPAYMAPEQATADPNIDHRVDIYAVGVMGYELLTGRTPFQGLTPQQMLAAHVTEEPAPISRYRPSISPALQSVVMRCLAKHASDRWQTAQELLAQLEPLMTPSGGMTPAQTQPVAAAAPVPSPPRPRWHWAAAAVGLALAVGAGAVLLARGHGDDLALGRRLQVTRDPGLEMDAAISPDGKLVAYAGGPSGNNKIFVRQIDGGGTVALTQETPGDLRRPQWTPDGSRIAFQSPRGIELVPALGGVPKLLVASPVPDSATDLAWSPDGKRFVHRQADSLFVRATDGGPARKLVGGRELFSPSWSPDARWIAYATGNPQFLYGTRSQLGNLAPSAVMVVPAEGGVPVEVAGGQSLNLSPVWLPRGRELLFISSRDGGRDISRVALGSDGRPAAPLRRLSTGLNVAAISVTTDGRRLAYSAFTQTANVWAVRVPNGPPVSARTARPVTTGNQIIESFDVSPDGKWLAFDSDRNGNQDIFRVPLAGGPEEQVTTDSGDDFQPHFSPDGTEIGFHAFRSTSRDLFVVPSTGGEQRPVVATPAQDRDPGWSPDGRRMSFSSDITGRSEIYTVAREGGGWGKPVQLTRTGGIFPFWSPDGRFIAYGWTRGVELVSPADGKVRPLPLTGPLTGKAIDAFAFTWAPDSRSLYTVVGNSTIPYQVLWSVPIDGRPPRPVVEFDDPLTSFGRGAFVAHDSTIYLTQLRSESDVWVAELTRP